MRISDWSSDVCSSDLGQLELHFLAELPLLGRASSQQAEEAVVRSRLICGVKNWSQTSRISGIGRQQSHELHGREEKAAGGTQVIDIRILAELAIGGDALHRQIVRAVPVPRTTEIGSASCRERVCK